MRRSVVAVRVNQMLDVSSTGRVVSVDRQVDWSLLKRAYANEVLSNLFSPFVCAILAPVTALYATGSWLPAAWWLAVAGSAAGRFIVSRRFLATADIATEPRWRRRYAVGTTISGLAWGLGGAAVLLVAPVPQNQTAILVVIAAMTAAAVVYHGAVLRAYLGYLAGTQLPIVAVMAFGPQPGTLSISVLALVYCVAMWVISSRYNRDLRAATRVGIERQLLSEQLANTNRRLEMDIDARLRAESLLSAERNLLENVAQQMSLTAILDRLNLDIEALFPGSKCSVALLEAREGTLRHVSAPSLPASYLESMDGVKIGPRAGSCGTAMYLKQQVITTDIRSDPLWKEFRDPALGSGLHACWSTPIVSRSDEVLGSFAIYRNVPGVPSDEERETINRMSRLIALVIEDIQNTEKIRLNEQRFRDFASAAADWFWEMDQSLEYTYVSERKGKADDTITNLILASTREKLKDAVGTNAAAAPRESPGKPLAFEFSALAPGGGRIEVLTAVKPVFDEHDDFTGWRGVGRDITRERALEREIRHQATHDSLTGLVNRREFERLIKEVLEHRCHAPDRYVAFIDLDRFKLINDNAGHHAGDEVLKRVADILCEAMPAGRTAARMGGDEFAVCFAANDIRSAVEAMERVVRTLADSKLEWGSTAFRLGASVGLVRISSMYKSPAQVLSDADASCYRAKNRGGGRVKLFQPDLDLFTDDARSTGELIRALKDRRALIHLQKISALQKSDRVPWYEALLRYNTREGAASPSHLIPAAERYGQMGVVDTWVLEQCLEQWGGLLADNALRLSLNLSATSITHGETANEIAKIVEQAHLSPGALCFEITETSMLNNLDGAAQFMRDLRGLGCSFVIDNFGSGQSNFSYLKKLPGDYLAIDGSYVKTMSSDVTNYVIVDAIHKVGRAHAMTTLAKYVESRETLDALRELGVDFAQGHFIGKAIPASDVDLTMSAAPFDADTATGT